MRQSYRLQSQHVNKSHTSKLRQVSSQWPPSQVARHLSELQVKSQVIKMCESTPVTRFKKCGFNNPDIFDYDYVYLYNVH